MNEETMTSRFHTTLFSTTPNAVILTAHSVPHSAVCNAACDDCRGVSFTHIYTTASDHDLHEKYALASVTKGGTCLCCWPISSGSSAAQRGRYHRRTCPPCHQPASSGRIAHRTSACLADPAPNLAVSHTSPSIVKQSI